MSAIPFTSERTFQLWRYNVGHSRLLLRSPPTPAEPTLIDIVFKPVSFMKVRDVMHQLTVRGPLLQELEEVRIECPECELEFSKVFMLECNGFLGYVVASLIVFDEVEAPFHFDSRVF